MITNQKDLRRAFWQQHPTLTRRRNSDGDYVTDTRCAFVNWVDRMERNSVITEALAQRATLEG